MTANEKRALSVQKSHAYVRACECVGCGTLMRMFLGPPVPGATRQAKAVSGVVMTTLRHCRAGGG